MNAINTYPEMNIKIKEFLRGSEDPMSLYAAARIEELEAELDAAKEDLSGNCFVCKKAVKSDRTPGMYACEHLGERIVAVSRKPHCKHFEWRGKEKQDG